MGLAGSIEDCGTESDDLGPMDLFSNDFEHFSFTLMICRGSQIGAIGNCGCVRSLTAFVRFSIFTFAGERPFVPG